MKRIAGLIFLVIISTASSSYCLTIGGTQTEKITSYLPDLRAYENSTANITSGAQISWAYGYDFSTFNLNGGDISWLKLYENNTTNISSGAQASWVDGYGFSTVNLNGGVISWLKLYENNTTNIACVDSLSWLLVNDNATVNIYGSNFSYSRGHLSGIWGNGDAFSFWALEESNLRSGDISGPMPDNIVLHSAPVPEPSTIVLLVAGFLSIIVIRKSNRVTTGP